MIELAGMFLIVADIAEDVLAALIGRVSRQARKLRRFRKKQDGSTA